MVIFRYAYLMTVIAGSNFIKSGLVLHLDAANPKSYPGAGTVWKDLSGHSNDGTLVNGTSISTGVANFDGVDDYIDCGSSTELNGGINEVSIDITVSISTSTSAYAGIITKLNSGSYLGWAIQYISLSTGMITCRFFGGGDGLNALEFQIPVNQITNILCIAETNGLMKVYINSVLYSQYQGTPFNTASTQPLSIGKLFYFNQYVGMDLSDVKIYNRALSEPEINQNFNAIRGRYGI